MSAPTLTIAQREKIRRRIKAGRTRAQIALELGLTYSAVVRVAAPSATPRLRLPPADEVLEMIEAGHRTGEIAARFGVSPASVSGAVKRARGRAQAQA